jgi:hypothetical protein
MRIMPTVMIGRAPNRSSRSPTGTCIAPYTNSWMTANSDRVEASASNRTAASTPTADSEVRFVTETTYAATPTPQTSHRRHADAGAGSGSVVTWPFKAGSGEAACVRAAVPA